jgi:hypothetical protein
MCLLILATWAVEIGGSEFRVRSSEKLVRSDPNRELGVMVYACNPSYMEG